DQAVSRTAREVIARAALHVAEELRIPAAAAEDEARGTEPEEEAPASIVPLAIVKRRALLGALSREEALHAGTRVDEREHAPAKEVEIGLELSGASDPPGDEIGVGVPEGSRSRREVRPAPLVERSAPRGGSRADELEQLAVLDRAVGGRL